MPEIEAESTGEPVQVDEYIPAYDRHDPNDSIEGDIKITHYLNKVDGSRVQMNDEANPATVTTYRAVTDDGEEHDNWHAAKEHVREQI